MTEQSVIDLRPKPEDIHYFGGCPTCWRNDGYLNIGREHWFICHKHRVKWLAGENLFSAWQFEPENQWLANRDRIAGYRKVDPKDPPRAKANQIRDGILEGAEVYLAEAIQALSYPEAYGLEDPDPALRGKALRKLKKEIEAVQSSMIRARGSVVWAGDAEIPF